MLSKIYNDNNNIFNKFYLKYTYYIIPMVGINYVVIKLIFFFTELVNNNFHELTIATT